jgi:hypothetical protein
VAEKTGWKMSFILWELPIAAGLQLCDAWAARNGAKLAWEEIDMDLIT